MGCDLFDPHWLSRVQQEGGHPAQHRRLSALGLCRQGWPGLAGWCLHSDAGRGRFSGAAGNARAEAGREDVSVDKKYTAREWKCDCGLILGVVVRSSSRVRGLNVYRNPVIRLPRMKIRAQILDRMFVVQNLDHEHP